MIRFRALALLLAATTAWAAGCETRYQGDLLDDLFLNPAKIQKASYDGLEDQTVAVLVDVDPTTFAREPKLRDQIRDDVCRILKKELDKAEWLPPDRLARFQDKNINWNKITYTQLGQNIGQDVNRLLIITVSEFRLHERGNKDLWRGHAAATVDVVELDRPNPDSAVASYTVTARYPGGHPLGVIAKDHHGFRKRTLMKFTNKIAEKFYDRIVR